ncbi:hypothetical protein PAPH110629_13180 [Paenibacillus phoenicis]
MLKAGRLSRGIGGFRVAFCIIIPFVKGAGWVRQYEGYVAAELGDAEVQKCGEMEARKHRRYGSMGVCQVWRYQLTDQTG